MVDLRLERIARGMTQSDLADRAGVSQAYIAMIERGTRKQGLKLIKRLSEVLSIPVVDFLDD
jgi:transcriptional regulator with XRE-family HTH domain